MAGTMKKSLLHEHHNRQDKAKKPDYRESMRERPRSDGPGIITKLLEKHEQRKAYAGDAKKQNALEIRFMDQLREGTIGFRSSQPQRSKVLTLSEVHDLIKKEELRKWRKAKFKLADHVLKLGWQLEHFAKINHLPPDAPDTQELFTKLKSCAQMDLQTIEKRIQRGRIFYAPILQNWIVPGVEWDRAIPTLNCDEINL